VKICQGTQYRGWLELFCANFSQFPVVCRYKTKSTKLLDQMQDLGCSTLMKCIIRRSVKLICFWWTLRTVWDQEKCTLRWAGF